MPSGVLLFTRLAYTPIENLGYTRCSSWEAGAQSRPREPRVAARRQAPDRPAPMMTVEHPVVIGPRQPVGRVDTEKCLRDYNRMAEFRRRLSPQHFRLFFGAILGAVLLIEFATRSATSAIVPAEAEVIASVASPAPDARPGFDDLIRRDPLAALEQAQIELVSKVRDYTCTFIKQELLDSGLSQEQTIATSFRAEPYSVVMHWLKNPGKAERVIYVKGKWIDAGANKPEERDLAVCQPGAIARVFVKSLKQPIRGSMAREASRRFIDEFGFWQSLNLLTKYSQLAKDRGELTLVFRGESMFDGRPTYVLERRLPYTGENGTYPDRVATIHIDKQWRVPVSVRCYADDAKKQLLGRYEYSNVTFDVGLTDKTFEPTTYGM